MDDRHEPPRSGVAVCLVGYLRTFVEPAVTRHIARAARRLGGGSADVFAIIANDVNDTAKGQVMPFDDTAVAEARSQLAPLAWVQWTSGHQDDARSSSSSEAPRCALTCTGQFAKFEACAAAITKHEARRRRRYEWVAKMRPDVLFSPGPSPGSGAEEFTYPFPIDVHPAGLNSSARVIYVDSRHGADLFYLMPRAALKYMAEGWRQVPCRRHWDQGDCPLLLADAAALVGWPLRPIDLCDCVVARTLAAARTLRTFGYRDAYSESAYQQRSTASTVAEPVRNHSRSSHLRSGGSQRAVRAGVVVDPWWDQATSGRVQVLASDFRRRHATSTTTAMARPLAPARRLGLARALSPSASSAKALKVLVPCASGKALPADAVRRIIALAGGRHLREEHHLWTSVSILCGTRSCATTFAGRVAATRVRMLRVPQLVRSSPLEALFSHESQLVLKLRLLSGFETFVETSVALASLASADDSAAALYLHPRARPTDAAALLAWARTRTAPLSLVVGNDDDGDGATDKLQILAIARRPHVRATLHAAMRALASSLSDDDASSALHVGTPPPPAGWAIESLRRLGGVSMEIASRASLEPTMAQSDAPRHTFHVFDYTRMAVLGEFHEGDVFMSLAATHFAPRIDSLIDALRPYDGGGGSISGGSHAPLIDWPPPPSANGSAFVFLAHRACLSPGMTSNSWPPPKHVVVIAVGMRAETFSWLCLGSVAWLRAQPWPIGVRDGSVLQRLRGARVSSFNSGCLTLALDRILRKVDREQEPGLLLAFGSKTADRDTQSDTRRALGTLDAELALALRNALALPADDNGDTDGSSVRVRVAAHGWTHGRARRWRPRPGQLAAVVDMGATYNISSTSGQLDLSLAKLRALRSARVVVTSENYFHVIMPAIALGAHPVLARVPPPRCLGGAETRFDGHDALYDVIGGECASLAALNASERVARVSAMLRAVLARHASVPPHRRSRHRELVAQQRWALAHHPPLLDAMHRLGDVGADRPPSPPFAAKSHYADGADDDDSRDDDDAWRRGELPSVEWPSAAFVAWWRARTPAGADATKAPAAEASPPESFADSLPVPIEATSEEAAAPPPLPRSLVPAHYCAWLAAWPRTLSSGGVTIFRSNARGFGTMLNGLLTAFWWAFLHRSQLIVRWDETRGAIDWTTSGAMDEKVRDDVVTRELLYYVSDPADPPHFQRVSRSQQMATLTTIETELAATTESSSRRNPTTIALSGTRGITGWLYAHARSALAAAGAPLDLSATRAAGCVLGRLIVPSETSKRKIESARSRLAGREHICVQIRAHSVLNIGEQHLFSNASASHSVTAADVQGVLSCAERVEREHGLPADARTPWYVTTDSAHLTRDIVHQYGRDKVITAGFAPSLYTSQRIDPMARANDAHTRFVVDELLPELVGEWWLLTQCTTLVITTSSLAQTAAAVAMANANATVYLADGGRGRKGNNAQACQRTDVLAEWKYNTL